MMERIAFFMGLGYVPIAESISGSGIVKAVDGPSGRAQHEDDSKADQESRCVPQTQCRAYPEDTEYRGKDAANHAAPRRGSPGFDASHARDLVVGYRSFLAGPAVDPRGPHLFPPERIAPGQS